jgi:hypothetical protein
MATNDYWAWNRGGRNGYVNIAADPGGDTDDIAYTVSYTYTVPNGNFEVHNAVAYSAAGCGFEIKQEKEMEWDP